jgi:mono/diheme cytochrome c family protein
MPMSALFRASVLFVAVAVLAAQAQAQENLDQNKSGATLFAGSCVQCHKSARGLAKGRMSFTLSHFLRQHYTSSSASADTLTAYLQSMDTPPAKAKRATGKAPAKNAATGSASGAATGATSAPTSNPITSRIPTGSVPEVRVRPPANVQKQ